MDTFMEKLAHRLTAQEMIKANTAAEAEELNYLKNQVRDYHECLDQMQNLVNESAARIGSLKGEETENYKKLMEDIELLFEAVDAAGEKNAQKNAQNIEELKSFINEKMRTPIPAENAAAAGDEWQREYGLLFEAVEAAGEKTSRENIQAIEVLKQFLTEQLEEIKNSENSGEDAETQEKLDMLFGAMEAAGEKTSRENIQAIDALKLFLSEQLEELKSSEDDTKRQEELGMLFGAVDAAGEKTSRQNIQAIENLKQFVSEKLEEAANKEDGKERLEEELERLFAAVNASGDRVVNQNGQEIDDLKQFIGEKLANSQKDQESIEQLKRFIESKIQGLREDKEASRQFEETVTGKLDESQEKVHKECVKVYRNVQAAMAEELEKQNTEQSSQIKMLKKRLELVTIVAGASAAAAVISLILQVVMCFQSL